MTTTYGAYENGYSLTKGDGVENMKEKSVEDKDKELNEACQGDCSKCILKREECADDEEDRIDEMYKEYVDNGYTLENKKKGMTIDEIKEEFRSSCCNLPCGNCIFNKYTDCFAKISDEELKSRYEEYKNNGYSLNIGKKKKNNINVIKNKHSFNSTQIISIKRKGRKLYMRYIDEDGEIYKVSASCHRDDDFDIINGLKVLTEKLDNKIADNSTDNGNFEFVALDNKNTLLTKGIIYSCVNGRITFDNGCISKYSYKDFDNFLMLNRNLNGYVLEVKGDVL